MVELPMDNEEGIDIFLERFRQEKSLNSHQKDRAEIYADYLNKFMWVDINRK